LLSPKLCLSAQSVPKIKPFSAGYPAANGAEKVAACSAFHCLQGASLSTILTRFTLGHWP
jgi:hypothetical protein